MSVCERCRHDNPPEREFCGGCGWYLRWELTGEQPPDQVGAGVHTLPLAVRADAVAVTLEPADPAELALAAGGELTVMARVRNGGDTVRRLDVRVEGLPDDWWSAKPRTLHLLPAGEGEVEVRLHPPRSPAAEARRWPFWIEVDAGRSVIAGLTVDPYRECTAALSPRRRSGPRAARFTVRVHNRGNARATVRFDARDDGGECRCRCEPAELTLAPGRRANVRVAVVPTRPLLAGASVEHAIEIAALVDAIDPLPPLAGVFRQRAWLSRALLLLIPIVIALLVLLVPRGSHEPIRKPGITAPATATPMSGS